MGARLPGRRDGRGGEEGGKMNLLKSRENIANRAFPIEFSKPTPNHEPLARERRHKNPQQIPNPRVMKNRTNFSETPKREL
jgi:hypothetical protein